MTTIAGGAPPRPPLARPADGRVLAGVAAGVAAHLGLDPLIVRAAFAVLGVAGIGVVGYGLLWLAMPETWVTPAPPPSLGIGSAVVAGQKI